MKQYTKIIDGQTVIRDASRIVIRKDGKMIINPSEEEILADGWVVYVAPEPAPYEPSEYDLLMEVAKEDFNKRTDVGNADALYYQKIVYDFHHYIEDSLATGQLVVYEDRIYRVRQDIPVVLADQDPSVDTAALYEVIEKEHTGEIDDPIPYNPPMEIFLGKYYTQGDVLYLCTRDSGTALTHNLADLVGIYVEVAENTVN